jgi:hypothetical protein
MNREKIIWYILLATLMCLFPACGNNGKSPYIEKQGFSAVDIAQIPQEELGKRFELKKEKEIVLNSGADIIGQILVLQLRGDKILVSDPIHSKQCYLFHGDGRLLRKVGRFGEGPGEYQIVLTANFSGDRIFFIENRKVNIYNSEGEFIKSLPKPMRGICNGIYEGPDGSIYAASTNRYNKSKDTIYHMDKDGNLIKTFSPLSGIPEVFDTYHPQTVLLPDIKNKRIFQLFNHTNRLSVLDLNGEKKKTITLDSPFYTAPDFDNANAKDSKAAREYKATFTRIVGLFNYSRGYVIIYSNWKDVKKEQKILEFRDFDFNRVGYAEFKKDEDFKFLTMHNDQLITTDYTENETKLVFMSIIPTVDK